MSKKKDRFREVTKDLGFIKGGVFVPAKRSFKYGDNAGLRFYHALMSRSSIRDLRSTNFREGHDKFFASIDKQTRVGQGFLHANQFIIDVLESRLPQSKQKKAA